MEHHASQNNFEVTVDHVHFFYFFSGVSIGMYSSNYKDFWSLASYWQLAILLINIVFVFTPWWKKIYDYNMAGKFKMLSIRDSKRCYIFIYLMNAVFLISQIGALIKSCF